MHLVDLLVLFRKSPSYRYFQTLDKENLKMKIPIFNIKKTTGRYLSTELFSAERQVFKHVNFGNMYLAVNPVLCCWQVIQLTTKHNATRGRFEICWSWRFQNTLYPLHVQFDQVFPEIFEVKDTWFHSFIFILIDLTERKTIEIWTFCVQSNCLNILDLLMVNRRFLLFSYPTNQLSWK